VNSLLITNQKPTTMIPGEYILAEGDIEINVGRKTETIVVVNTGDRPVQIGSHFHFFEVNKQLAFDRAKAFGMRLNIAAGTAVRFEPGEEKEAELVAFGGAKRVVGFSNLVDGEIDDANKQTAIAKAQERNFKDRLPNTL
jgi:urease beta subunit